MGLGNKAYVLAGAVALAASSVAHGQSYSTPYTPGGTLVTSYGDTLTAASPTWRRATAAGSEFAPAPATTLGGTATSVYPYHQFSFTPAVSGVYDFYSAQAHDGYLLLYSNPFDPTQALVNNIGGDDDMASLNGGVVPNRGGVTGTADSGFRIPLTGGTTYQVITTPFSASVPANGLFHNEIRTGPAPVHYIPDGGANQTPGTPLTVTLNVPDHGSIISFDSLDIRQLTHTFTGDTVVTLRHVDTGTTVDILDRHNKTSATSFGFGGDLIGDYTFVDGGPALPTTGTTVAPGTYGLSQNTSGFGSSPFDTPLSSFVGEDVFGTWELTITDFASGDLGAVSAFAINVTVPEPACLGLTVLGASVLAVRRRRQI